MTLEKSIQQPAEVRAASNLEGLRKNPNVGAGIILGFDKSGETAIQVLFFTGDANKKMRLIANGDMVKAADNSRGGNVMCQVHEGEHVVSNLIMFKNLKEIDNEITKGQPCIVGVTKTKSFQHPEVILCRGDKAVDSAKKINRSVSSHKLTDLMEVGMLVGAENGDGRARVPSRFPLELPLEGTIDEIAKTYSEALGKSLVCLAVKTVDLYSGKTEIKTVNKNK